VPSTFFLQGRWVEAFEATARRVADEGHLVGNHSHYHARLPLLTDDGLVTDVATAEEVIRRTTGTDPRPWFRCPFAAGSDDPRILGGLERLGYRDIGQDLVLDDWEPHRTGEAIARDVMRLVPGLGEEVVVLFHTWPTGTLDALPRIIEGLRAAGASFVRVDSLTRFAPRPQ
jgi:peptidoglycan/xylan/chitin deacetylase (PgdA/CDA1 family)